MDIKSCSNPIPRRHFIHAAAGAAWGMATLPAILISAKETRASQVSSTEVIVDDPDGSLGRTQAPVSVSLNLYNTFHRAAAEGRLSLREKRTDGSSSTTLQPVQSLGGSDRGKTRLDWLLSPGPKGRRTFILEEALQPGQSPMRVVIQQPDGQYEISEGLRPVLRYNYAQVEPGDLLKSIIAKDNQKYAIARSNYIHPLFGPQGECLTKDWSLDHPHHRGIYWAWPEVDWRGQRGDLHALQRVFARPTGNGITAGGPVFAQVEAENFWEWETGEPIVHELAVIRAYRSSSLGRFVDLELKFTALHEPVRIARRDTSHYGGLNLRLGAVKEQQITTYTDSASQKPCPAWSDLSGTFPDADQPSGLTVIQHASNPDYPGDWVQYPELNWLQPTFPAKGSRYELVPEKTLVLRYRLWIHPGAQISPTMGADCWRAAHSPFSR